MNRKQVVKALLAQFTLHKSSLKIFRDKNCCYIPDTNVGIMVNYPESEGTAIVIVQRGLSGSREYLLVDERLQLSWWESRKAKAIYYAALRAAEEEKELGKYEQLLKQAGLGVPKDER